MFIYLQPCSYLRDMLYNNKEIAELFNEETIHVIDYDLEYDKGFPDPEKFPEYNNKLFSKFLVEMANVNF